VITTLAGDDAAVKTLFDHVRNLGICAVVFGAAAWQFRNFAPDFRLAFVLQIAAFVALVLFGVFLFAVNMFHGVEKLKRAGYPTWIFWLVMFTYSIVTVTIVTALSGIIE
jgi:hypothetical protein